MPKIIAARHALPPHEIYQSEAKQVIKNIFWNKIEDLDRLLTIFDNSLIERRQLLMPPSWYGHEHSATERNQIFLQHGLGLARKATSLCLESVQCQRSQVDHFIFVTSTGHATPTPETYLINELGLPRTLSRLPIWGLGCAGGAAGLSRAYDYCLAHPKSLVLVTALECCSLTFVSNDLSKKNLVGTSLFADGAAAVLVAGDDFGREGPRIHASMSHLFPDSSHIMGWSFTDDGMELVLSPKLPALIKHEFGEIVDTFLEANGLERSDLIHYLTHPGGARVIDAFRSVLGLNAQDLMLTYELLRDHGNISSVSILIILEKWLASKHSTIPGQGLISAFGPGFSAEMLLIEV